MHLRRGRQPPGAGAGQQQKAVLDSRGNERRGALAPVGEELVERARLEDGAREDVGADLRALLDDADRNLAAGRRGELLQADRGGEARRPGADHDHVVFHPLARRPLLDHPASAKSSAAI